MYSFAPLFLALQLGAIDVDDHNLPAWILPGILAVETHSRYNDEGGIVYVDRKVGASGELGCCQITEDAFETVYHGPRKFWELATDNTFSEDIAAAYLHWIYSHWAHRDWKTAVGMYNAGPDKPRAAKRYLRSIIRLGGVP